MTHSKTSKGYVSSSTSTFLVGQMEEEITENKFLLSQSSKVFKAMLCGELQEKRKIMVPDVEPYAFRTMLRFLNGKRIRFSNMDHAVKVCYAADKYDLPVLKKVCAEYIFPSSTDEIYDALDCGVLYNIDFLTEAAMKLVCQNTYKVLTSKHFLTLSRPALKVIVQDDHLDVKAEVELFEAVINWAKYQCLHAGISSEPKNLRDMLGDVLHNVRFLIMDIFDVMKYGKMILTADEIEMLLMCVNSRINTAFIKPLCCKTLKREKQKQQLPTAAVLYTVRFNDGQEKQIVKSSDIKCQLLSSCLINLYSVTIPTRSSLHEDSYKMYLEEVVVELKQSDGHIIASGGYIGKVEYDSEIRIQLFTPDGSFPKISSYKSCDTYNSYDTSYNNSNNLNMSIRHGKVEKYSRRITYNLEVSFNSISYYPLRMCNFSSVFPDMANTFSFVIAMEYSK